MSTDSILSPQRRKQLQELFENGSRQMSAGSFDYACEMFFTPCVIGDPGNIIYMQAFLTNLQRKYGDKKKKGMLSFLGGGNLKGSAAIKAAEMRQNWKGVLLAGIEALKADPWNAPALFSMGKACLEMGHTDTALAYLKSAISANPDDVETNRFAAKLLREMHKFDDAIACWVRVQKIVPDDEEARKTLSDILVEKTIKKGAYDSSEKGQNVHAASVSKKEQVDAEFEDVMGRVLSFEEAAEKKIAKEPEDIDLYLSLADHFFQKANYKKAEETFVRALKVSNNDPVIQERLFEAQKKRIHDEALKLKEQYEKTKKPELKEQFYKKKEELDAKTLEVALHRIDYQPTVTSHRYDLGLIYMQRGKIKEAIAEFQAAKADTSKQGDCLLALGQCFQQIKQHNLAMTHYQQAIAAISDSGESKKKALYLAAKLAIDSKNKTKAEEYLHNLAAIDFSYKDVGDLLDKLTEL